MTAKLDESRAQPPSRTLSDRANLLFLTMASFFAAAMLASISFGTSAAIPLLFAIVFLRKRTKLWFAVAGFSLVWLLLLLAYDPGLTRVKIERDPIQVTQF